MATQARGGRMSAPVLAYALASALAHAPPAIAQTSGDYNLGIDHFGLESGLPGMYVTDMSVAADGRLWLNASGRLVSFDGLEFEIHDLTRFAGKEGTLRGVAGGRGDTVWVVVDRDLYSYVGGQPTLEAHYDGLIRKVWQDAAGEVWVWDDDGILRLSEGGFERVVGLVPPGSRGLIDGPAASGRPGPWLLTPEPGVVRRINLRWVMDPLPFPETWPVPDPMGRAVLYRTDGARTAVTQLDGTPVTSLPPEAGDQPFLLDSQGLVWTSTPGRVHAVDSAGHVVASLPLPAGERVGTVVEDGDGNVWLGTMLHGLYRIHPRPVRVVGAQQGLTDGEVMRLSAGPDGTVLAVDQQDQVYRIGPDGAQVVLRTSPPDLRALGAFADRRGTTWISEQRRDGDHLLGRTAGGGTIDIRGVPLAVRILESPVEEGALWVMSEGVFKVRPYASGGPVVEGPFLEHGTGLRDMAVGPDRVVWVTGGLGLGRIGPDGVEEFLAEDGFPSNGRAIHLSADGTIWIGRYTGGIVRFRDGEFGVVRAADGLWDDAVTSILEDDDGNLWMGSNRGVHRVARRELDAFLDGEVDRVRGRGYGLDAGFQNAEASGWNAYRSPDGRMWFPTFSGVAVIDPAEALAQEQTPPGVRIRSVRAGSDLLEADSALTLPRGERRIDVAYGAILLSGQEGVRYEVRLDGMDEDWVDEGAQRQVTYGNLPPGRHVFRVRAVSGAGVPSRATAAVALTVPPFFHETGTFMVLMGLLAGGALWLVYHARVRQLRTREATLERLVDDRTRDLARAKQATEAALVTVEAQARELRSLDEAKSRFFANVSHELRTPLTLVQGPLQDVMDGRLGPAPDAVREQVATVLASGRRLGELVEQLLDVARLESGEMHLTMRRQDLKPLLDRLAASFAALARSRGIDFRTRLPDGAVHISVDADQMEKVYGNLLANAFKFTPEGGSVGFTAELRGGELVVTVEDDGPGIPGEEQKRIFERFHQVDGSSRRVHGGAGLGLALVKEIVELHGGTVELWSEPGRGSRFTVRVPQGSEAEHGDGAGVETAPATDPEARASAVAADDAPAEVDDTVRPTVLVVEDNDELRAYLHRHLADDYRVEEARNGREGLAEARRAVPDVILCDVMMPEMDGEELCRAVRADPELSFLPVIMVTARASRQSRLSSLEGGADDYLVKPFDPTELRLRVANLLAARRRLAERLREQGASLPFIPLELPHDASHRDFASRLTEVLREHMEDEDFGVDDLAKALAMSRSTLYRQADDALGASPMDLLWGFRLEQAAHWFRETDATVSEVAYACGFKTVPHFTRKFKARFGTTPAAYRSEAG